MFWIAGFLRSNLALIGVVLLLTSPAKTWGEDAPENQSFTESSLKANLSGLKELIFHPGINNVFFSGIGKEGQVTVAYTEYDSIGSHFVYLVTIKDDNTDSDDPSWLTVPIGDDGDETIDNAPLDGELVRKSVRFFNGLIGDQAQTLLIISSIESLPEKPGVATIAVEELANLHDEPPYQFVPILKFKTTSLYSNANNAIWRELGIPLPGK